MSGNALRIKLGPPSEASEVRVRACPGLSVQTSILGAGSRLGGPGNFFTFREGV